MSGKYKPGDFLIYKKQKRSGQPGPRAHSIAPAVQDEKFMYVVDKFWVVEQVHDDGTLDARTPGGKRHRLSTNDPNLRRPTWWQRIWYRSRFRQLMQDVDPT
jgi:hypothetical protein